MGVVLIEGFDYVADTQLYLKGWTFNLSENYRSMVTGRLGTGQGLYLENTSSGGGGYALINLPTSLTSIVVGVGMFWSTVSANPYSTLTLRTYAGTQVVRCGFVSSSGKTVLQMLNSAGTVLATGTTNVPLSQWHYVELKAVISATVGSVELRLNGSESPECSATGLNLGTTGIGALMLASPGSQLQTHTARFDDLYVVDASGSDAPRNTFLGECRVETLRPVADGNSVQFTPSTGANWQNVDDATTIDSDTTYNTSSTIGDLDTFEVSLPVGSYGTVAAVQANVVYRKSSAGYRRLAPVIRYDGVDNVGADYDPMYAGYALNSRIYNQTPLDEEWSPAAIMLTEFGYKVTG